MIYLVIVLGLFLRLINLNQSYWLDEAINVLAVKNYSPKELIFNYSLGDFHPPLYHLFLWVWTRFFGYSEIATRFLSIIFALLTVYLIYKFSLRFFNKKVAILTSLLLATSPLHIYYSQETRMYMATGFFSLASMYFFVTLLNKECKTTINNWLFYVLTTIIFLYLDYLPYLLIIVQNFVIFTYSKENINYLKKWILSQSILIILLIPWIGFLFQQVRNALAVVQSYPLWGIVVGKSTWNIIPLLITKFTIGRISIENKLLYFLVILPIVSIIFYLFYKFWINCKDNISKIIRLWFIFPIVLAFLISFKVSIFSYFRFIFLLPLFYLIIVLGINTIPIKSARKVLYLFFIIINIGSLVIFNTNKRFWREDWKSAVNFIESQKEENSITIMVNPAQNAPYIYYSKGLIPLSYKLDNHDILYNKVWLLRYVQEIFDPDDKIRINIESQGYKKRGEYDFSGVVLWEYSI